MACLGCARGPAARCQAGNRRAWRPRPALAVAAGNPLCNARPSKPAARPYRTSPMASAASHVSFLPPVLIFCAAAVVAVPLFRRLGLSRRPRLSRRRHRHRPVGPCAHRGPGHDPRTSPSSASCSCSSSSGSNCKPVAALISMRRDIFGLGLAQLARERRWSSVPPRSGSASRLRGAVVAGIALALSATAIALQMLEERGDLQTPYGQRTFAILLFQDLSIAPIAGAAAAARRQPAAPRPAADAATARRHRRSRSLALALIVLVGRYVLNPFFRILAASGAREVMTASRAPRRARRRARSWSRSGCRWRWAPSSPACSSPSRTSATSSRPTSSRSAACCSGSSS